MRSKVLEVSSRPEVYNSRIRLCRSSRFYFKYCCIKLSERGSSDSANSNGSLIVRVLPRPAAKFIGVLKNYSDGPLLSFSPLSDYPFETLCVFIGLFELTNLTPLSLPATVMLSIDCFMPVVSLATLVTLSSMTPTFYSRIIVFL
jgi:hypothetical protein